MGLITNWQELIAYEYVEKAQQLRQAADGATGW
jgi:hypothetical protein